MPKIINNISIVALCLTSSIAVCAASKSSADLIKALMQAHTNAFGNKENALTQRLTADEKQFWLKTVSEVQEFISSIETIKSIFPSKEKNAQQEDKRLLIASMDRLVRVNDDLLNSIAAAFGTIALGLPASKKASGTRSFKDIDPTIINVTMLKNYINPLAAQKVVAIDVQNKVKKITQTKNQQLSGGAALVERLGLLLETTIQFTINSFKKLSDYIQTPH